MVGRSPDPGPSSAGTGRCCYGRYLYYIWPGVLEGVEIFTFINLREQFDNRYIFFLVLYGVREHTYMYLQYSLYRYFVL